MQPTPYPRRHFGLRVSLGSAFVAIVLLTTLSLATATFLSLRSFIRDGIRQRLAETAGIAALQVDAATHKTLSSRDDESTAAYGRLRTCLQRIREQSGDIRFVYTLRQGEDDRIRFVVDAETDPAAMSHCGDFYTGQVSEEMLASFRRPYRVQVEYDFYADQWGNWLTSYAPILTPEGELAGVLGMDIAASRVVAYERRFLLLILAVALVVSVVGMVLGITLARRISQPLVVLASDMRQIRELRLEDQPRARSHLTEVIMMQQAVDSMKSGLRSFKKYVPADLVAELVILGQDAVLSAEKRELTLFFSDIRGFTGIAEALPPEQLAADLAVYFEGMVGAILQQQGTVDKFMGDGIMAFWGAPQRQEDQALLACRAALRCQQVVADLSRQWQPRGMPPFSTRIGLNTGPVIVGNMGYEQRLNYTALGDHVNLASRLQELNKHYGTHIILSEHTYAQAQAGIVTRLLDEVAVRGRTTGVRIYELLGCKGEVDAGTEQFAKLYEEAMGLFLAREWAAAWALFEETGRRRPGDVPSSLHAESCQALLANPPGPDWTGLVVMQEK